MRSEAKTKLISSLLSLWAWFQYCLNQSKVLVSEEMRVEDQFLDLWAEAVVVFAPFGRSLDQWHKKEMFLYHGL